MKICVTGALGHIGAHLIRHFELPDLEVVHLIDNLTTQRYASLFDLPKPSSFIFHELDILDKACEPIIQESDVVIHLAAITNAEASFYQEEEVIRVNEKGLKHVADLCFKHQTALIFPSTTSVYGMQNNFVDENCPEKDLKPQSPYAVSKLNAEKYLKRLGDKGLSFIVLRLGTIFGFSCGMRFHTAVNKFIWQAIHEKPLSVWRTALEQQRPYCGVDDCARAMQYFIRKNHFSKDIFNIVSANATVEEIIDILRREISHITIDLVDSPIMNQLSYAVSNQKSLTLGFEYRDNLADGIFETIRHLTAANSRLGKTERLS